jgi:hypothetical protein
VCTYNGSRTLRTCLEGLQRLEYPNYEVIVIDDGSTDDSAAIAQQYPVRVIRQRNEGLSSARNTGMDAAGGEIIAYLDDDAWPDPHWLHYLAWTYLHNDYAAVGGPNIPPPEDGAIAECVANSPGGPAHVMISHREAEHIPGCNCSFLTKELRAIGGFDAQFRTAGDDVDVLAAAGTWWEDRLPCGRHGMASPPGICPRIFEAAVGVRKSGGIAGSQVAGKILRRRWHPVGGPGVRQRVLRADSSAQDLPRALGHGSISKVVHRPGRLNAFGSGLVFVERCPGRICSFVR